MKIAIIPARGGSTRIRNKNIKLFYKKPIIYYSIMAARKSGIFDKVFVSTDCLKTIKIVKKYGAEILRRPKHLCANNVGLVEVVEYHLKKLLNIYENISHGCCLFATAPLINKFDLKKGFKILKNYTSSFPVCEYDAPIQQAFKRNKNSVLPINNKLNVEQSQKLKKFYYDTGTFYFFNIKKFLKKKSFFSRDNVTFILPKERVQDINTIIDFNLARIKYAFKKK
jgi:pseudaminic acid cytidylyltransferase